MREDKKMTKGKSGFRGDKAKDGRREMSGLRNAGLSFLWFALLLMLVPLLLSLLNASLLPQLEPGSAVPSSIAGWIQALAAGELFERFQFYSLFACLSLFLFILAFTFHATFLRTIGLLGSIAALAYANWPVIGNLIQGGEFQLGEMIVLGCALALLVLILLAVMTKSHRLGVFCAIASLVFMGYHLFDLYGFYASSDPADLWMIVYVLVHLVLRGLGMAMCAWSLRKSNIKDF